MSHYLDQSGSGMPQDYNDQYSRIDPYQRRDVRHRMADDQHGRGRGSRVFGDGTHSLRPQDGHDVRRPSGDGFRSDSYRVAGGPNSKRPEPAIYEVDHLVTFDISPKLGMRNHKDGLERLKHMQVTSGVWTMRYLLSVDDREIVITEKTSRRELESFPISRVFDPVNITSDDPQELYNDIVIFIVEGESSRSASEMHIFQSIGKCGQDLIDDIEAARKGKFPRPLEKKDGERHHSAQHDNSHMPVNGKAPSRSSSAAHIDTYDADADILYRCFDSIESFVASLQKAANAQKKLDDGRSRISLDANELQTLMNKARPPPAREYIDVFQKFKFALNLLPKLKHRLNNPNAQELTHLLFSPLAVVVESSSDPQGKPKLASSVTSPLLNRDTCILLDTSLHANEISLWRQLGDAWNIPAELWTGPPPPPYTPQFTDNSKPAHLQDPGSEHQGSTHAQNGVRREESGIKSAQDKAGTHSMETPINPKQEKFLQDLRAKNAKVYRVTSGRESKNQKELTVIEGEYVEVLEDTKKWWKVSNINKESGYIPSTIVNKV